MVLSSIPDEGSIFLFRHRLKREGLTGKLFQKVEVYLSEHGLIVNEGTIPSRAHLAPGC